MAKRKTIKRCIHALCAGLWAEAVAAALYSAETDRENVETLLHTIIKLEKEYVSRVSHVESGIKARDYFNALVEDFNKRYVETADLIENIH